MRMVHIDKYIYEWIYELKHKMIKQKEEKMRFFYYKRQKCCGVKTENFIKMKFKFKMSRRRKKNLINSNKCDLFSLTC